MTKISLLPNDSAPVGADILAGVENSNDTTSNFKLSDILTFIETNGLTKTGPDANGWYAYSFGGQFKLFTQTVSTSGIAIGAGSASTITTLNYPVGYTNSSQFRMFVGQLGGYLGRVFAGTDNGNSTSNLTSLPISVFNTTAGSITWIGFVYIFLLTI